MQGSSRAAFAAGHVAFAAELGTGVHGSALAGDLFGVTGALDSSASLRRALVDPSRDAAAKRGLVEVLFATRISAAAAAVVNALVSQHWADDQDLGDATEALAVEALVASAEAGGRLDALEDDLFRFERLVAADAGLRDALSARGGDENVKAALVEALLAGKASVETIRLARQAAVSPRGRRFGRVLESYLAVAAQAPRADDRNCHRCRLIDPRPASTPRTGSVRYLQRAGADQCRARPCGRRRHPGAGR